MLRNIEIYNGKYIDVDFDKVKKYFGNIFLTVILCVLFVFPDKIGDGLMTSTMHIRQISFLVISFFFMIALILIKILDNDIKFGTYEIILSIYTILIVLSCIFSEYKSNVLFGLYARGEGALTLFAYLICFYIMKETFVYNQKTFKLLSMLLVFASCIGLLQALNKTVYEFKIYGTLEQWKYMACSNFHNPNMFSSLICIFMPIYLFKYINQGKKNILIVLSFLFAALVTTKTLGGYITFVIYFIGIFVYSMITNENKKEILKKYICLLSIFLIIFITLNMVNDNAYMGEIYNEVELESVKNEGADMLAHGRVAIWKISLGMIKENLLWGVGPDSMGCEMREKYSELYWSKYPIDKAHSEYLHIAVTTGIPSLIVYLILIIYILTNMFIKLIKCIKTKGKNHNDTLIAAIIGTSLLSYLFQASANISTFCVAPFFWCMLGIAVNLLLDKNNNI